MTASAEQGAFVHYMEKVEGRKIRMRSPSFGDHYSQATLFWNSMTEIEKEHIVEAAHFELGKVEDMAIRERIVDHFNHIDHELAVRTAKGIGVDPPAEPALRNHGRNSPALSQERGAMPIATRKVAILASDGVDSDQVEAVKQRLSDEGAQAEIVSKSGGQITASDGSKLDVDKMFVAAASVMFDALLIPGGPDSIATLLKEGDARHFVNEAFRHCKPIGALGGGYELLRKSALGELMSEGGDLDSPGVVAGPQADQDFADRFVEAMKHHRHWDRQKDGVPA
jgi:catalase